MEATEEETYRVFRKFKNSGVPDEIIAEGLSLKEAQEHCEDPDTCSADCVSKEAQRVTLKHGPWMDCYYRE